ncbi:MAG: hypothetical protein F2555_04875 [Actinobacteria bacterium]|uniref:Unannotated protein n=1 Tax=freshwater metagenome TaxID=449393 RepID=A0A6J6EL29_9ZZZZ|nr:hypothetical protein [Actinomycetota bacterium]
MRLKLISVLLLTVSMASFHHPAPAAPKIPSECLASGSGINKKIPTSFEELILKRKCISYAAWKNVSSSTSASSSKPTIEVLIGPNTKPFYLNPVVAVQAINSTFSNSIYTGDSLYIYFNFKDSAWAKRTVQSLLTADEYENISRNQGDRVIENGCDAVSKSCFGSQAITLVTGKGLVLLGVPNSLNKNDPTASYRFKTGMLEAHEHLHLLQDAALFGEVHGAQIWPPRWITEGGAEYIQNAVIHKNSWRKYRDYRFLGASELYRLKSTYSEKFLIEYLQETVIDDGGSKYDSWLSYNLGSRFVEILVALKGPNSLLELNSEIGMGMNFAQAFEKVYGISWNKAVPILAKVVSSDIAQRS